MGFLSNYPLLRKSEIYLVFHGVETRMSAVHSYCSSFPPHLIFIIEKSLMVHCLFVSKLKLATGLFRPAIHTDFISIYRFFTLRIWQNTDFLP